MAILIGGTGCVGKSNLATQLSDRLNLPSVLKTDLVCELMNSIISECVSNVFWCRDGFFLIFLISFLQKKSSLTASFPSIHQ
jgi:hypothetical protein